MKKRWAYTKFPDRKCHHASLEMPNSGYQPWLDMSNYSDNQMHCGLCSEKGDNLTTFCETETNYSLHLQFVERETEAYVQLFLGILQRRCSRSLPPLISYAFPTQIEEQISLKKGIIYQFNSAVEGWL